MESEETRRADDPFEGGYPQSEEAEQAILGSILINNSLMGQAKRLLQVDDFYGPFHRFVFHAMSILDKDEKEIDPVFLAEVMKREGTLGTGGVIRITRLMHGVVPRSSIATWANIVRQHAKSRWLHKFASRVQEAVLHGGMDPDDVARWIVEEVGDTSSRLENLRRPMTINDFYEDQALRMTLFHKGISDAIPTGFPSVDEKLLGGGLLPGLMYVLAGRPSMGKTTFALDVVANVADQGRRVMVVTRETPREMLVDRMVAAKAGVARFKISAGMSKHDYDIAMETLQSMRLLPIVIDDFSTSIREVDGWLTEYERVGQPIELIALDYLQLMSGGGDSRVQEVSAISGGFKGLLTKHKIPGLLVSNLNRQGGDGEPELYHLRESGQVEFDADTVMFIHGDPTEEDVEFLAKELICKKQRDGPHFRRPLDMNTSLVTFRTPAMLGLDKLGKIEPRRMGTDDEEIKLQKKRGSQAPKEDDTAFDF